MIAEHAAPILAALGALPSPIVVSDGQAAPGTEPPYVVVYVRVGTPEATTFEAPVDRVQCTAITHSVGGNATAARILGDLVAGVLLGIRPTISGRDCGWVRLVDDRPMDRDEVTLEPRLSLMHVWQYVSLPA